MNLMEITKGYEPKQNEQTDQTKNSLYTTDKWKLLAKEQAEMLEKVTVEKDELQVRNQKMNEFIQKFQERTNKLKMEKQNLFFENHEMQDEIRKLNDEIHRLTTELSETQKLNQSLQKNNDDLRNRNGLKSRSEQEQLEEEIKDVRDQNSKLQIQVNKSSVEAGDEAQKKQKEAEKKMEQAESKARNEKKRAELEIQKNRRKAKREIDDMKENQYFWIWGYVTVILFSIIQNGAFQRDILQFAKTPVKWWRQYIEWFEKLEYLGYTASEVCFERVLTMTLIMLGIAGSAWLIWAGIKEYKKIWDDIYKMVLISSASFIAVLGNGFHAFIPVNLILLFIFINVGVVLLRKYYDSLL